MEQKLLKLLAAFSDTSIIAYVSKMYSDCAYVGIYNTQLDIGVYTDGYMLLANGRTVNKTEDVDVLVDVVRNYKGQGE